MPVCESMLILQACVTTKKRRRRLDHKSCLKRMARMGVFNLELCFLKLSTVTWAGLLH